jgi:hypothetical protein
MNITHGGLGCHGALERHIAPSLSAKREYNAFGEGCSVVRLRHPDQTYASEAPPEKRTKTPTTSLVTVGEEPINT